VCSLPQDGVSSTSPLFEVSASWDRLTATEACRAARVATGGSTVRGPASRPPSAPGSPGRILRSLVTIIC
jgi:hypothetical protein